MHSELHVVSIHRAHWLVDRDVPNKSKGQRYGDATQQWKEQDISCHSIQWKYMYWKREDEITAASVTMCQTDLQSVEHILLIALQNVRVQPNVPRKISTTNPLT